MEGQVRIEAFTLLNRTGFNAPNALVDSAAFATISGASGGPLLQVEVKLLP